LPPCSGLSTSSLRLRGMRLAGMWLASEWLDGRQGWASCVANQLGMLLAEALPFST
jgi:hypothetical protein